LCILNFVECSFYMLNSCLKHEVNKFIYLLEDKGKKKHEILFLFRHLK
jgi:hypothetical protein